MKDEWPCDNYTEPHTCLSARTSQTAQCRVCRIRAADRLVAAASRTTREVIDPYEASEASSAMIEAAAAQAFRCDDLRGHVAGKWDWDTIPAIGRRDYRALVVAVLDAAIAETERQADS